MSVLLGRKCDARTTFYYPQQPAVVHQSCVVPKPMEPAKSDNVLKLPEPKQEEDLGYDPEFVAMCHIDEILSYAPEVPPHREPGEIDVEALRDAFTEYFAPMIDEQVKSALKPYVALGHNNPFKHMPTTTAGYLKVVRYLKQFEL